MTKRHPTAICLALALGCALAQPAAAREPTPGEPAGNPGDWVTTNDYPAEALRASQEGTVHFRVDYDASGIPTGCTVTVSSGVQVLDDTTCRLIVTRARFTPGADAKGKAAAGSWTNSVRWVIPKVDQPPPAAMTGTVSFIVGVDGTPSDCRFENVSGSALGNEDKVKMPCGAGDKFKPYIDAAGKPVAKRVRVTQIVTVEDAD